MPRCASKTIPGSPFPMQNAATIFTALIPICKEVLVQMPWPPASSEKSYTTGDHPYCHQPNIAQMYLTTGSKPHLSPTGAPKIWGNLLN